MLGRWFSGLALATARITGTWQAFAAAFLSVFIWFVCGFFVGFSNELYQIIINTITTILTFLMVFLLQSSQNSLQANQSKESTAILLKLDELIRANHEARNQLVGLEDKTEEEIARVKAEFAALASGPARDARGRFVRSSSAPAIASRSQEPLDEIIL